MVVIERTRRSIVCVDVFRWETDFGKRGFGGEGEKQIWGDRDMERDWEKVIEGDAEREKERERASK